MDRPRCVHDSLVSLVAHKVTVIFSKYMCFMQYGQRIPLVQQQFTYIVTLALVMHAVPLVSYILGGILLHLVSNCNVGALLCCHECEANTELT